MNAEMYAYHIEIHTDSMKELKAVEDKNEVAYLLSLIQRARDRYVTIEHIMKDRTLKDIANELSVSPTLVRMLFCRALREIRQRVMEDNKK